MAIYYYTAKTQDGQTKSGTMEAKDETSLAHSLREGGLILISAQVLGEEKKKSKKSLIVKFRGIFS